MNSKIISLGVLAGSLIGSSLAQAGTMGPIAPAGYRPVITVLGGVGGAYNNSNQTLVGTDGEVFFYDVQNNNQAVGFGGAFIGLEHELPFYNGFFVQIGAEYDYFGNLTTNGLNIVGIEPATTTVYNYSWTDQSQQALGVLRLLTTVESTAFNNQVFYPYLSVGLGVAVNRASNFNATTLQPNGVNLTAFYGNNTQTSFSYNLGIGFDTPVYQNFRVGLGYRFSDFGQASLGTGQVSMNQFVAPATFALGTPHIYVNQFVGSISYVA